MELKSFEAIVGALADREVRCLLVGGVAVVAHGHGRMTHDLDLATLIEMKEASGRPIDLDDVRHLRLLGDHGARP